MAILLEWDALEFSTHDAKDLLICLVEFLDEATNRVEWALRVEGYNPITLGWSEALQRAFDGSHAPTSEL